MFNIGPEELLLILVIALIVFGPNRLPEVGRTIGKSLREFRRASEGIRQEFSRAMDLDDEGDGFDGTFKTVQLPEQVAANPGAADPTESSDNGSGPGPHDPGRDEPSAGSGPAA